MNWFDIPGEFKYLKNKVGNSSVQATRGTKRFKDGVEGESHGALPMVVPFKVALEKFIDNSSDTRRTVTTDEIGKIEKKDIISIHEYEISAKARELRHDYERPEFLDNTLRHQATKLTLLPKELGSGRPTQNDGERFLCMLEGSMAVGLLSPVFKQNLYNGVFDDLEPHEIP